MKQLLFLILLMVQFGNGQLSYISPGIGFSWDLQGRYIFTPKLSYGILQSGYFVNITVGGSSAIDDPSYPNSFLELQCGQFVYQTVNPLQFCIGGGVGITVPDNDTKLSMRVSLFTGYIVFANTTILFEDTMKVEFGGHLVAPLPLGRITM